MAKKKKKLTEEKDEFLTGREQADANKNFALQRGLRCSQCRHYKECQDRKTLLRGLEYINCTIRFKE